MNDISQNGDVSSGIGLLKNHTFPQDIEPSNLNYMIMSVDNGDVNGDYCYRNSSTGSESKNHNSINYTNKIDEISTNRYLMENIELPDGVGIDVMLPVSKLNQYSNTE